MLTRKGRESAEAARLNGADYGADYEADYEADYLVGTAFELCSDSKLFCCLDSNW